MINCKDCKHWKRARKWSHVGNCHNKEVNAMCVVGSREKIWTINKFGCVMGEKK